VGANAQLGTSGVSGSARAGVGADTATGASGTNTLSGAANAGGTVATQGNSGQASIANSTSQPTVGGGQVGASGQAGVGGYGGQNLGAGAAIDTQQQLQAENQAAVAANQNAQAGADRNARWRFRQHNGEWWYWTPQNTWMIHRGGNWIVYDPNTYTVPQTYSSGGGYYVEPGYSNRQYYSRGYRSGYAPRSYGYSQDYYDGGYGRYDSETLETSQGLLDFRRVDALGEAGHGDWVFMARLCAGLCLAMLSVRF
jgi:hypothetical protein